ncbi:MAG: STAS domain-containing protein [Candidatus Wallbacteria bacterium]
METKITKTDNYVLVQVIGTLDQQGAFFLKNTLVNELSISDEVPENLSHLIIDFAEIESISSSGIGLLASLQRTFNKLSKFMSIVKIPYSFQQILMVTNLLNIFSIYNSLDEALKRTK